MSTTDVPASATFPRIISADDHIVEPPNIWTDRLPQRYLEVGPRIRRERVTYSTDTTHTIEVSPDGVWADVWYYEDRREALGMLSAAVGYDHAAVENRAITYDELRPGCYDPAARLADMDIGGVEASLCFPNTIPVKFCGQGFLVAHDRELAALCVRAYNDYMLDEWCGPSGGRLIPLGILPLWDAEAAAAEVRRTAALGMRAMCFSEAPAHLGLPSLHGGYWDPLFAACEETETVLTMHIGSSSRVPRASDDAPAGSNSLLVTCNATTALIDWLYSGLFVRYPRLKILLAECQIGWIPYYLQRADEVWEKHRGYAEVYGRIPEPPSSYYYSNVFVTYFSDNFGLHNLDVIGVDNVLVETDYPHSDSTWPDSSALVQKQTAHLDPITIEKLVRGNARKLFRLE